MSDGQKAAIEHGIGIVWLRSNSSAFFLFLYFDGSRLIVSGYPAEYLLGELPDLLLRL